MTFYEVHYRRWINTVDDYVRIGHGTHDLPQAAAQRGVSGDLVVEIENGKAIRVCPELSWLWDWERADPKEYAHRAARGETR